MERDALDAALLVAHDAGDRDALITLYAQAADGDGPGAAFYLTHAYVFALEAGDPRAVPLRARLLAMGAERDEPFGSTSARAPDRLTVAQQAH